MKLRWPARVLLVLSAVCGGGGLLLFVPFLWGVAPGLVRFEELGNGSRLMLDALLCLAFFLQHSLMTRRRFKEWFAAHAPAEYHAAVYSVASGLALLALVSLWQESTIVLFRAGGPWWWILRAGFVLGMGGIVWSGLALRDLDTLGLRAAVRHRRAAGKSPELAIRGPYRWVRHPLYLFALVLLWTAPDLTADRLLLNVLFTIWIVVGIRLEERDLVLAFGETYRLYRTRVPMLLPFRGPYP